MAEKSSSKKLAAAPVAKSAQAAASKAAPIARPVAPPPAPAARSAAPAVKAKVDAKERHRLIAEAAYYRALKRGFSPGNDVQDWIAAEKDVDARIR